MAAVALVAAGAALLIAVGPRKPAPAMGYGNELIFQSVNDSGLNQQIASAGSAMQRYPGGTPSGFWSWRQGWEVYRQETDVLRPTLPLDWARYLSATHQGTLIVPNILTSNLTEELAGLEAMEAAGVPVTHVELGNEMYDSTVPAIVAKYNASAFNYSAAMGLWVETISNRFPQAKVALCGGHDDDTVAWNQVLLRSPAGRQCQALTSHVYTPLPEGPYTPEVWFTEVGAYGGAAAQDTWIKALFATAQVLRLSSIPQATVVTPYCLVCHDPFAPSFNTSLGPLPPPPNATYAPGPWNLSPTGWALSQLFQASRRSAFLTPVAVAVDPSQTRNATWCALREVGVAGAALPHSGQVVADAQACMDQCLAASGCAAWQLVLTDHTCWLKGEDGVFTPNSGSISGPAFCTENSAVTAALFSPEAKESIGSLLFLLNGSPDPMPCLNVTAALPSSGQVAVSSTFTDPEAVARHGLLPSDFNRTTNTEPGPCVFLPPWSLTIVNAL